MKSLIWVVCGLLVAPAAIAGNTTAEPRPTPMGEADVFWPSGPFEHIRFETTDRLAIHNYSVDGTTLLDAARYIGPAQRHDLREQGNIHTISVGDDRITLIDGPSGLFSFRGGDDDAGVMVLTLADVPFDRTDRGAVFHLGDREAVLVAQHAEWQDGTLEVRGFASIHLRPVAPPEPEPQPARDRITKAIADRQVAAEVSIDPTIITTDGVQVDAYDDVEVTVTKTAAIVTDQAPLIIRVSAELDEGRTFVARVPTEALGGPDVTVRGFTVNDDGTRTELLLREADSLEDVLDASDDQGQFEYWVVKDKNGVQVLMSAAHFSTHEFQVAGIGAVLQPSIIAGLLAGIALSVMAAVGLFWPKRR